MIHQQYLYVPINQTGTYTLLTHSTLFGGTSTTEPITLAAKFTNISPEMNLQIEQQSMETESNSNIEDNSRNQSMKQLFRSIRLCNLCLLNLTFNFDMGIGIVIGIAIGIVVVFIVKQKPPK